VPVFGSLFTLLLLPLFFLRRTRRVWCVYGAALTGVFVWYWMSHQDRYLQALVPWMAALAGGIIRLAWLSGVASQAAIAVLVALQVIWGGDLYFIPNHAMMGTAPAKAVIDLLSSGYRKDFDARKKFYGDWAEVGRRLPPHAKVLIHDYHERLGIHAMAISDIGPWQGGISYGRLPSARALYDQLHDWGVTHFLFVPMRSAAMDSLGGDFAFWSFVGNYVSPEPVGGFLLGSMPTAPPPERRWTESQAAVFVCSESYAPGLYQLRDLLVPTVGPRTYPEPRRRLESGAPAAPMMAESDFVARDPACHPEVPEPDAQAFKKMAIRNGSEIWIKKAP